MSYRIAVASLDRKNVDVSFGATSDFLIYEVSGKEYRIFETRNYVPLGENLESKDSGNCGVSAGCSRGTGCGNGSGCGIKGDNFEKVKLISDCRCVICKKIGFQIQKQLEKLAITGFDVECPVEEALRKITQYLERVDGHQSLRGIARL